MASTFIMVVEDNEDSREMLADLLSSRGYRVATAENGRIGLKKLMLGHELPGLVLLDLSMPVMDGWQMNEAMRGSERLRGVPVVVVSAVDNTRLPAGALGLVRKPIEFSLLFKAVERFCGVPAIEHHEEHARR